MEWTAVFAFGATSGLIAAGFNQIFQALRERWARRHASAETKALRADERAHEEQLRADERAHEEKLRRQAAHDFARIEYGGDEADVADWIDYRSSQLLGPDLDYYKHQGMNPELKSDADAAAAMWRVGRMHPTRAVRLAARAIAADLDDGFFSAAGGGEPSREQFKDWNARIDLLIESIQSPLSDVAPKAGSSP